MKKLLALALAAWGMFAAPAQAEVRFGRNVSIGGHNFSHQTYGPKRRLRVYLYDRQPRRAGCRWVREGGRAAIRVCHLRRR